MILRIFILVKVITWWLKKLSLYYTSPLWLHIGHDTRIIRTNEGSYLGGTRPRVSFKTHARPNREIPRSLALASLDEDIPMTGSANNNTRQVIIRDRGRGMSRGRNSPLPSRNFRGGQSTGSRPRQLPLGESNWYRISVRDTCIYYIVIYAIVYISMSICIVLYIIDTIWSQVWKRVHFKNPVKLSGTWGIHTNNSKYSCLIDHIFVLFDIGWW